MMHRMSDERLRIAVVGAGTVGCYVGGRLARGADITLVGRERVLGPVRQHGLTVGHAGRPTATIPARDLTLSTDPAAVADADVIVMTVKSAATEQAAQQIAPHRRPGVPVVSLQNGLENPRRIAEHLDAPVVAGMVPYNVIHEGPATFLQTIPGDVLVGGHPDAAPLFTAAERAVFSLKPRHDMDEVLHGKLLLNLNNAINALSGRPLKEQLATRDYRRVLAACMEEALATYAAKGVTPARMSPLSPGATVRLLRSPDPVFATVARSSLRVHPDARSSMADDLRLGRATEIDELQGAVVRLGERHGVDTPVCRRVVELVHAAEAAGPQRLPSWSGADLVREVTR